jgi:hypothetical protein
MIAAVVALSFSAAYCAIFSPWNGSMKQVRNTLVNTVLESAS